MSVLTLLNMQKFLKYEMENSAAWCAPEGSCVVNIPNEEGKGDSLSREQRTAVMVIVWEVIKAAANALCAFWVFEWKCLLLILPDSGTVEYLPFHRVYLLPIYFTCENRLYIILLKEMEECNPKLGLNSRGSHCGTWVLDKPP